MQWGPHSSGAGGSPSKPAAPQPAHRYRNKAAASLLLLRGQRAADVDAAEFADPRFHAGWAADPLVVGASAARFGGCQMAATLLAADQVGQCRAQCHCCLPRLIQNTAVGSKMGAARCHHTAAHTVAALPPPLTTLTRPSAARAQACVAPLRRMQERGYRMASSRAFLHQYQAHGLEEAQLLGCFAAIEDILARYAAL